MSSEFPGHGGRPLPPDPSALPARDAAGAPVAAPSGDRRVPVVPAHLAPDLQRSARLGALALGAERVFVAGADGTVLASNVAGAPERDPTSDWLALAGAATDVRADPRFLGAWGAACCTDGVAVVARLSGDAAWTPDRQETLLLLAQDLGRKVDAASQLSAMRLAEQWLQARNAELSLVYETAQISTFEWDIVADEVRWSDRLEKYLGMAPGSFAGTSGAFLALVHPLDRTRVEAALAATLERDEPYHIEFRMIRADGSVRWTETRGRLFRDAGGRPQRLVGVDLDISCYKGEQGVLAAVVKRSDARLRAVIDSMKAFIGVVSPDGVVLEASLAPLQMAGLARSDVIGRTFWDCAWWTYDDAVRRRLIDAFHEACAGKTIQYDETIWTVGDGRAVIELVLTPVFEDGRLAYIVPSATDVTSRVAALAKRAESERQLRLLADNSPDVLTRFDRNLRHTFVSDAMRRIFGLAPDWVIGRTIRELGMPEGLFEYWEDAVRTVLQTGETATLAFSFELPAGIRHFRATLVAERDGAGEIAHVLSIASDITDIRNAQDALSIADRRKDEFLAVLSHELRGPLAPLRNGLAVLRRAPDADATGPTRQMMDRQLAHLVRLIDDLLDVTRISTGKINLRRELVTIGQVLDAAVEAIRPQIEERGHRVTRNALADGVVVRGDPTRLAQVVANLLNNAAKYTPTGGRIDVCAEVIDDDVQVDVVDDGIGIPADMLDAIFDMFAQVAPTPDRVHGGLGIGLGLVRRLVQMHGGSVEAFSDGPGRGSRFRLKLPVYQPRRS